MGLVFHNLKKSKGQYISFGVMLCITAFIMNIALVLAFQTSDAYDDRLEELNTADINVLIPLVQDRGNLADEINDIDGVLASERHEGVFTTATVRNFAESDFDMNTVFYNLDAQKSINRMEVEEDTKPASDAVYVPAYMIELGGFSVGNKITYSIDGKDYTFTIGGIISEMQYGNYGTGLIGAWLPEKVYKTFSAEHKSGRIAEYSIQKEADTELNTVKNKITDYLSDKGTASLNINDRATSKQSRTMVCNLLIAIFIALAVIILLVNIFLSNFRIRNKIEDEITDMGALKAIGYTSRMIIFSTVTPYTLIGGLSTAAGAAVSYTVLPAVAKILAVQSGFSFNPAFDLLSLLATILFPTAVIFVFAFLAARKIRRLEAINALRGIAGTGAGKNHFPLETAKTGIRFTLILKQIASSAGQNILLFVLSFGIMILLSFAAVLLYNVNIKPDNFMDTLSEESPSVIFTAAKGKTQELKNVLKDDAQVNLVLEYAAAPVSYADGSLTAFVCEDFSLVTNDVCYKGRNPAKDNEIALGSSLAEKYEIGSKITITKDQRSSTYTVTGFVQSINNSGNVCELTKAGYEKISETAPATLNIYLNSGTAKDFITKTETAYPKLLIDSVNAEQLAENGQKMYAGIVSAVSITIFLLSMLVVLLVMYIIINSMLTRRRQEFGIYKALGWSSRQLVLQSAFSFIPVIAVSAVLSAFAGLAYMPAVDNAIFAMLGAMKNHFEVPLWLLLIFAILFTMASFLINIFLAAPIKRITAYSLLKE